MKYFLILLLSFFTLLATAQDKVVSYSYVTFDNEYQNSVRKYIGYDKNFIIKNKDTTKEDHVLDITPLIGWRCYFFNGYINRFNDYRVNTIYRYNRNLCVNGSISFLGSNKWSPIFYDGFIRYNKGRLSTEVFSEKESVGTPLTNDLRYVSYTNGLSVDLRASRRITLVNSIANNRITDGNSRWFYSARIIYTLKNKSYTDIKIRRMIGGNYSPYYFSPNEISQYNIGWGFNRSFKNDLGVKFYFGSGLQFINNESMLMLNYDLRLTKKLNKNWNFELSTGSRNFNTYIFNTVNIKFVYTITKDINK